MGQRVLGKGEEKLIQKALEWGEYKDRMGAIERLNKRKHFHFPTKGFILGFFGIVSVAGLSVGAMKTIPRLMEPTPASVIGTEDKKLSMKELHKKYVYTFNEQGNVVPRMPDDYKTLVFLFGDSVGSSMMAWSSYFGIAPAIVVAIICAENGSSLDQNILNTVGRKFTQDPHLADQTISRSGARGIAQIKKSTAEIKIKKLVREGRWPFKTTNTDGVLSDYDMSIFLLCALIQEIQMAGYNNIADIAGIYHSGHNGWSRKKAEGKNADEVWKEIEKAQRAKKQYEGVRAYLSESTQNE
ncbi:MAG: hypothetical protein ACPL06_00225 [Candidatus Anstonellales archaeon]